jgi:hypothetical protein
MGSGRSLYRFATESAFSSNTEALTTLMALPYRPVAPSPLIKDLSERLPKDAGKIARINANVYYER